MGGHTQWPTRWLTTRQCADIIGMSTAFIRGEIHDGLLQAEIIPRPVAAGRRRSHPRIRVYPEALRIYLAKYWPCIPVERLPAA